MHVSHRLYAKDGDIIPWFVDSRNLNISCSCRSGECDPDHSHVGGQHSTEDAGGKVQKRRPPPDSLQRHIW